MSGVPEDSMTTLDFSLVRVLVVGDIMLDRYFWGVVQRISPEAPVPVIKMQRSSVSLGGAGNVVANLAGLDCAATIVGLCGRDAYADTLKQLLNEKGIQYHLVEGGSRHTTAKTRVMAQKQQVLRLDEEDVQAPSGDVLQRIRDHVLQELERCQVVILSDYGKGMFAADTLSHEVIELARRQGRPVLVDPKGTHWERYQKATCITPNTAELEALVGIGLEDDERGLIDTARSVRAQFGLERLLVTRGPKGMCLVAADDEITLIPAQAREVFDVSGAGDTVIATLAAGLGAGMPFERAARVANTAAGVVVGKLGTQPILHSELSTALRYDDGQHYFPYSAAKMTAMDGALARVREWRTSGDKIVFTNGCFDLLHPGHISLLYQARALGERLIVGLNTDGSVRRLKGPRRPILGERDRAAMLGALTCVDMVVLFEQDTPLETIAALQPDILVKGSDYQPEQVVGKEIVESYGGCIKLVKVLKGYSTTGIAEKITGRNSKLP
jgi:D-beta-D-heptose 7-phosphate kinase / D-beta-D-heptose 1-phosphate adenosyltransferase